MAANESTLIDFHTFLATDRDKFSSEWAEKKIVYLCPIVHSKCDYFHYLFFCSTLTFRFSTKYILIQVCVLVGRIDCVCLVTCFAFVLKMKHVYCKASIET